MSPSDTENRPARFRQAGKTALFYLGAAAFCVVFDNVYALFGHGIRSASMTWMFLWPLLAGALPFGLLWLSALNAGAIRGWRFLFNLWNSGVAALTVAAALQGVFDIAGASSPYVAVFRIVGGAMAASALIGFLAGLARARRLRYDG